MPEKEVRRVLEYFLTPESELPAGVGFSLFGKMHILWLCIAAAVIAALCLGFRRLGPRGRRRLRAGVGCCVLALELARAARLLLQGWYSVYYLPLHLCSMSVFFCFAHSLRPGETLGNFLYSTCMPGAAFALLFPDWTMYPALSYSSCVSFLAHSLIVAYPLMLVSGGELRPRVRMLPCCLALLAGLAAAVYVFDRAFDANYMFLLAPAAGSPLEWFYRLLGNPGYLLGYVPMLAAVWCVLYLPFRKSAASPAAPS